MADKEFRIGLMEQRLIEHFAVGGTADDAAEVFGVTPAEAYQRVKSTLERADIWTMLEMSKMNVIVLQKMLRQAREAYDPNMPKQTEAMAKLIQAIDKLQRSQFTLTDADIERAAIANAERMREIVQLGYNRARSVLVLEYPDVPVERIDEVFQAGLLEAARDADLES